MRRLLPILLLVSASIIPAAGAVRAQETSAKTMLVAASVAEQSVFTVKLLRGTVDGSGNAAFDWTTDCASMDFGELTPFDNSNPRSALASQYIYMAYCICENNSGARYYVKYDGAPLSLSDASATLANDAWVVSAGAHTGASDGFNTSNTAGLLSGKISGADANRIMYTSTADGKTDVFRVYFSIVGNPAHAVKGSSSSLIPYSQKPGAYSATVTLTMYN